MSGALGNLGRGHASVEPERDTRMPEVVRPPSKRRVDLPWLQGEPPCLSPHPRVAGRANDFAGTAVEEAPVLGGAVPLEMFAEDGDELRRYRHGAGLSLAAVL
jgi:hypothetical protein